MNILIVSYEFPPTESPQGLRWAYLARELAHRGHEVRVLSAALMPPSGPSVAGDAVSVTQVFPGPFVGTTGALAQRMAIPTSVSPRAALPSKPSWSVRAYRVMRNVGNRVLVPDVRSEWLPWCTAAARRLIAQNRPDVIIASHEPGVDLAVAARLKRRFRLPLLMDLGDPIVSAYTPGWRRRLDQHFERKWLGAADAVSVTSRQTRDLLCQRVPRVAAVPIRVLTQGYDDRMAVPESKIEFDDDKLELLYTGTLYDAFRSIEPLLLALRRLKNARLTVIGHADKQQILLLQGAPQVRYLGRSTHLQALAAQRAADVLVNIGNDLDVQIPGKLFEYMGARKPILHIATHPRDACVRILEDAGCGWCVCAHDLDAILTTLDWLKTRKLTEAVQPLDAGAASGYSWRSIGVRLEELLHSIS